MHTSKVHRFVNFTLLGRKSYMPDLSSAVHGKTGLTSSRTGCTTAAERPGLRTSVLLDIADELLVMLGLAASKDTEGPRVAPIPAAEVPGELLVLHGPRVVSAALTEAPLVARPPPGSLPALSATTGRSDTAVGRPGTAGSGWSRPPVAPSAWRSSPAPVSLLLDILSVSVSGAVSACV